MEDMQKRIVWNYNFSWDGSFEYFKELLSREKENVSDCTECVYLLQCNTHLLYENGFPCASISNIYYVQWVGILNKHIFEACELAQAQTTLILIIVTPVMIFSIFAPVGVKSLKEHKGEGRCVEKMSQYGNQTTQLHLMMMMMIMMIVMMISIMTIDGSTWKSWLWW